LNRAQRTAVTTLSGPLLVLAGAGTGKTRVITFRIAELIKSGIQPGRILAVTFTNKAAKEMRERAVGLLGRKRKQKTTPEISTFHSLCVRVLRRHATRLGYPEQFTIYDRGDQESVARSALRDIRVGHEKLRPGDLLHTISSWKSQSIRPAAAEKLAEKDTDLLAALAYARYQASLRAAGAMDFDDLLLLTEQLFVEHPEARFAEASRFDHLLIDEYQDTNGLQYRIVRHLAERHRNLCVVGDDDQSIYGWRGAEVQHILNFKEDWPEARVVRLEENYRSTEWVLRLANTLIAHNSTRHDKVLRATRGRGEPPRFLKFEDETAEAEAVVREIRDKITREDHERVLASDIAILFRTNEQPRAFEQELRREKVPYVLVGGQSFYDRKEIKDLLGYLKVLANPNDEVSLLRIINTPSRGIGANSVQALLDDAIESGQPLWKLLPKAKDHPQLSAAAALAIEEFRMLIDEFRARVGREKLSELFRELVTRIDYKAEIERQHKEPGDQETRWNAVEELVNAVATYESRDESPSLLGFLEEAALTTRDEQKDSADDRKQHAVTLMTLHSAKGLEFPHVYLVGMEEGLLPHKRSVADGRHHIDEERRLAYVGVTRAQDTLTLSVCKHRMKWGKLRPQIPSRFLMEMRGETERALRLAEAAEEQIGQEVRAAREREEEARKAKRKKAPARPRRATGPASKAGPAMGPTDKPPAPRAVAPSPRNTAAKPSAAKPAAAKPVAGPPAAAKPEASSRAASPSAATRAAGAHAPAPQKPAAAPKAPAARQSSGAPSQATVSRPAAAPAAPSPPLPASAAPASAAVASPAPASSAPAKPAAGASAGPAPSPRAPDTGPPSEPRSSGDYKQVRLFD
jgi:DNA helicase-2/ATP-dependent DNA helicase PcrA